jgi:hypothetical protein
MNRPNIIALPTSQMAAYCDVLGLGDKVQESTESMIKALEVASFKDLKRVPSDQMNGEPNQVGFDPDDMGADIVAARNARLGR